MFQLAQTIRNGFRMVAHARGLAIIGVLMLGSGANVAVFAVVHAVLVRPLPHPDAGRLVAISSRNIPSDRDHQMAPLDFFDFERGSSSFARMAAYYPPGFTLTGDGAAERVAGVRASSGIFDVFGVRPVLGRGFLPEEDTPGTDPVAVISHDLWERRFQSDSGLIGRPITLSGNSYTVVGVLPGDFDAPAMWPRMPDVWVPIGLDANAGSRDARMLRVLGRLRTEVTIDRARADLDRIATQLAQTYPELKDTGVTVTPLLEQLTSGIRPSLLMLLVGAAALLLVSAGNTAGLILAGTLQRRIEFSTRLALGATRVQVLRQIVGEHLVLGTLAASLGFVVAYLASGLLVSVAAAAGVPRAAEIEVGVSALVAGIVLSFGCTVLCAVVAGLSTVKLATDGTLLRNAHTITHSHQRAHSVLLALEAAFSLALFVGAILLVRSFYELQLVNPGFDDEQTYTFRISPPAGSYPAGPVLARFYDQVVERVQALPGVDSATVVDWLPSTGAGSAVGFTIDGAGQLERHLAELRIVGRDYFKTLSIPVIAGREFEDSARESTPRVVLVNESFVRAHFGSVNAVGRRITFDRGGEPFMAEIIGVTRDVREVSRRLAPGPGVYAPKTQMPWLMVETRDLVIRVASGQTPPVAAIQGVLRDLEPDAPIGAVLRLADATSEAVVRAELYATAALTFSGIAVLLAAFGIYGVVSAVIVHESRQIGIRVALGATSVRVARDAAKRGVLPTVVGLVVGIPLALGAGRIVRQQLFGVQPTDAATLAGVAALMMTVAVVASLIPARRAARIDPAATLRHESAA
jgi:putative ABC transport system permease protein